MSDSQTPAKDDLFDYYYDVDDEIRERFGCWTIDQRLQWVEDTKQFLWSVWSEAQRARFLKSREK